MGYGRSSEFGAVDFTLDSVEKEKKNTNSKGGNSYAGADDTSV